MTGELPYSELFKADLRVAKRYHARTPRLRARGWQKWIIDFANTDLNQLGEGDWLNIRSEIGALGHLSNFSPKSFISDLSESGILIKPIDEVERQYKKWLVYADKKRLSSNNLPSKKETFRLQSKIKKILSEFAISHLITFGTFTMKVAVIGDESESGCFSEIEGGIFKKAMYAVAHLIGTRGGLILKCPVCNTIFIADRINQKYCSGKCQQKVATRKYRMKKPYK